MKLAIYDIGTMEFFQALVFKCCCLVVILIAEEVSVYGSQVWRIELQDDTKFQWLRHREEYLTQKYQLDFWRPSSSIHQSADIMISDQHQRPFNDVLKSNNLTYSIMIGDVEALITRQRNSMKGRKNVTNLAEFDYGVYHPVEEIKKWVTDFAKENSDIATEIEVSKSYEGRIITGLKISTGKSTNKRSVWFEGGIHAREWIAPATVMYITNQLVTDYKLGAETVMEILDKLDFYIVPSLNVDGYHYTWQGGISNRLWRKTRSPNEGSICIGTDPNRNWPYEWGGTGSSKQPCSGTYRGSKALSEVEMQGVTNYALKQKQEQEFIVFIDWHSYSQLWLSPWSYSVEAPPPEDKDALAELGNKAVAAIKSVHGREYTSGPTAQTLYEASGASNDWGYATLGAKYSYVVELRDTGEYGVLLPEDQIIPTGEECYEAIKVVGKHVIDELNNKNIQ